MRWSWKVAKVAGIDIKIHATFFLLVAWIGFSYYLNGGTLAAALNGVVYILALFLCVALHELGHSLAARKFNIETRDITLLPIGGVARLERMPEKPRQELWVALAGPLVNVVIAAVLFAGLALTGSLQPLSAATLSNGTLLERLMLVNLSLAVFNLIPAFPMDGGRVVRALLATRLEYSQATRVAATLGQGIAFVFGLIGLFSNPFLIFIALFVYIGAQQEANLVQVKSALSGITVEQAMLTNFQTLREGEPLSRAVELTMSGSQQDFPVLSGDLVVGVLTRKSLLDALQRVGQAGPVSAAMECAIQSVRPDEMLEDVSAKLQQQDCHTVPVVQNGQLVGLVTMENIGEFLMFRSALRRSPNGGGMPGALRQGL